MRSVKLILRKDMDNLGASGDVVTVKPGYARNYLIPHGYAYAASDANLRRIEEEKQKAEERAKKDYLEARRRASQLEGVSITFQARAGEEGKLFGSVTSADIADRLTADHVDFELERRIIQLGEPLKQLGAFMVSIKLHSEVISEVEVVVERGED